ncbi:MAG: DUF6056 family protein, partial [Bacteroidota bacterium]
KLLLLNNQFRKINLLVFGSLFAIIIPYIVLSFFSHPIADDFSYAYKKINWGLYEAYKNEYLFWNGRYFANLLVLLNPISFSWFTGYKLIPVFLILLTFFSFYFFISAITNKIITGIKLVIFSLLLTLLYIFQMPTVVEGFYMYTGSTTYQLANVLALFQISLIIHFLYKRYFINKIFHILISLVLLFIVIGCNEVIMLIMLAFYFIVFLISIYLKSQQKYLWLFYLAFAICCSLIVILSPGNAFREAHFPDNHQLFYSIFFTLLQTFRFSFDWISNIPFIFTSILFIPISLKLVKKVKIFKKQFYIHPLLFSCFLFIILFLCIFPPYWSTCILGQHRTVYTAYFFFIILWFINLSAWVNYYSNKKVLQSFRIYPKLYIALISLTILSAATTKNGYHAFLDIFYGKAVAFDKEMNARYETLKNANSSNIEKCVLKPINNKPATLFFLDITPNHKHWLNTGYAQYFDIKEVHLYKKK